MGFQSTLRWVQGGRAAAIIAACVSVIMFSFILDMRFQNRQEFLSGILPGGNGQVEVKFKSQSGYGSMALFGLAVSLVWNGLCLIDLCLKKHYRFERRICMFLDMVVAMILLITGFLNFAYDSVLYFDLDIAPRSQVILEVTAVAFLGLSCLCHLGFFCHGCKDSNSSPLRMTDCEHTLLPTTSPAIHMGAFSDRDTAKDLVNVELGQNVRLVKVQHHQFSDGTISSPVVQFEGVADPRGAANRSSRSGLLSTPRLGAGSPPTQQQQGRDWF